MLNWNPEKDTDIRDKAVKLHEKLHSRMSQKDITRRHLENQGKRKWRRKVLRMAEEKTERSIHGKILEIGAGDGYLSAYIAHTRGVSCVYAMEYDKPAVKKLIPKAFEAYSIPSEKYKVVYGSFNRILEDGFDYIIAMGALHHSENLQKTLKSCYKALRPGGYLISSEPCEPNMTTNAAIVKKMESLNKGKRFGESFVSKENSDHYYRLCEYEVASYYAGFNIHSCIVFGEEYIDGLGTFIEDPETDDYDRLFLLLYKPEKEPKYIPNAI